MIGTPASGNNYSWVSNPAGFVSTSPNPIVSPLVTTSYYLAVINAAGIIARDTVVITVTPAPLANAGIDQGICTGTPATIGSPPVTGNTYSWTSNPAGFNSNLANPVVTPTVNTQYFLAVANSTGCIGKDTVAITVNSTLTPTATISASNTTICSGQGVIFNATITNGGSTPSYQWQVNGTNAGTNSSGFTSSSLVNGNQVRVILTSSLSCASPASVTSNIITMTVNNTVTPIILINGNVTVLTGQGTLLSAAIVNGGNNPLYQWQDSTGTHTWQSIAGATATTLNYTPAQTGDKLRCVLTSNATCVTSNTATSNALAFIVNTVTAVDPVPGINYGIIYYPNPASSTLYIDSLRIADKWQTLQIVSMDGKQIMNAISLANQKKKEINVERLLPGQYIAVLRRKSGAPAYLKFIKL